jgi:TolB-like protein/tetratricopeptide (TPR) repeat protein
LLAIIAAAVLVLVVGIFYFVRARSTATQINSIAVLPFVNATADPNNDYLSDGLTESLIGTLSRLSNLKVMARSTVFKFKGKEDDPRQIGQTLQVSAVLLGRITQRGDQMAVQVDLVDTSDGSELWGSHYERRAADVPEVQGDITRDVSTKLGRNDAAKMSQKFGNAGTTNPEAYRLYLEGRQLWYGRTPDGLKKSIDLFQQAIAADPNYALAYTGLSDTYNVAPSYIPITSKQGETLADEASRKAVELDDSLSEAHAARAFALSNMRRWSEAEPEFQRAIALNPNNASVRYFYAFGYLAPMNRMDEALDQFQKAVSLDPLSSIVNANYAVALMEAHRYPESLAQFQKTLARDPNSPFTHWKLSHLYATMGRFPEAIDELNKSNFSLPASVPLNAKGYLKLAEDTRIKGADRSAAIAMAAALAGDRDEAFQYLEKSYADEDNELLIEVRYPALDSLRSDPRFADLMHRLGLPQ